MRKTFIGSVLCLALVVFMTAGVMAQIPNDDCAGAIDVGALPASVSFDNTTATDDIVVGSECGVASGPWNNVWYTVTGTGNTLTATTCNAGTNIDTKISVFCPDCVTMKCATGNDDSCVDFYIYSSTVSWCSEAGVTYLITVGGYSSTSLGPITLDVTDDGVACAEPPDCSPCYDNDGDNYNDEACGGDDCDDIEPDVNPGADEICDDGIDNDCDDLVDGDDPACTGGNDCTDGIGITLPAELDFLATGSTCGKTDDYEDTCLGYYDGGEDLFYELTITEDVDIRIGLDPVDTYTGFLLDDSCPPDPATCLAVSSASSGPHATDCLSLTAGTYYIMVDTWPSPECITSFDLTIEACEPCVVDCPPEGIAEDEVCGAAPDVVNGGCNSDPPVFTAINPGETVCAETWAEGGTRDTDWFEAVLAESAVCTFSGTSTVADMVMGYVPTVPVGTPDCSTISVIDPIDQGEFPCDELSVSVEMGAGTHWFFAGAGNYYDNACANGPWDYTVALDCTPCADADADGYLDPACGGSDCDDNNANVNPGAAEDCFDGVDNDCDTLVDMADDDCVCSTADFTIDCNTVVSGDTTGGTDELHNYSCSGWTESGPDDVYELTLAYDAQLIAGLSNLAADLDVFILADEVCSSYCIAYGDATAATAGLVAPGTYYIVVDGYNGAVSTYDLSVACCPDVDGDGFTDAACGGLDCDDSDPLVNPDADEICDDGVDNDCDGLVDLAPWDCCDVECPAGAVAEDEPCGDDTNGGCNADPYVFGTLANGDTVCGNVWADAALKDTDWYEITLAETSMVTFTVEAEFPVLAFILEEGSADCLGNIVAYDGTADPCTELTIEATLPAGIHWLWVGSAVWADEGMCEYGPHDYVASVSWIPCYDVDEDGFFAEPCGMDCDDANGFVNPCGTEIAGNGVDENCTGWDLSATPTAEVEPNEFATPQELGGLTNGSLVTVAGGLITGDQDCYKFSVPGPGFMDIALAFDCAYDFDLYLFIYDEFGTFVAYTESIYAPEFINDAFLDTAAWGFDYGIATMPYGGEGDYELEFEYTQCVEESKAAGNCADGIDNDCDGLIDTDPECTGCFIQTIF